MVKTNTASGIGVSGSPIVLPAERSLRATVRAGVERSGEEEMVNTVI
jgi:hypothetical protein